MEQLETLSDLVKILDRVKNIQNFNLCDIWRIRNPQKKRFTFQQQHKSGFIQRRLEYFFLSNTLLESTNKTDALAGFATDHWPLLFL